MKTILEVAAWLRSHDDYLILTHRRPDGDAIGSAVALCLGLRAMGKQAELFPNAQFGEKFSALTNGLLGSGDPAGKTVISVDMAAETLLPYNAPGMAGKTVLALDHHGSNTFYAEDSYVDADAAACGELVYLLLKELGVSPDPAMANAIYVAVSTDTGCFRYGNTTPQTLRVAAACLEAGADAQQWNRILFLTRSPARLNLEAHLTRTTEFYAQGKIALCSLPRQVVSDLNLTEDDLDDISGFPRDIAGVEIGIMLREIADGTKISLRTFAPWDASEICAVLGGGGHKAAAGATVNGTMEDAKPAVLDALRRFGAEV